MSEQELDPIAQAILSYLADAPANKPVSAEQIAKHISDSQANAKSSGRADPNAWRRYFQAVKNQAFFLARTGRVDILRKGDRVAPEDLKGLSGVWRMCLPKTDQPD